jgi:hypothetical protein
MDLPGGVALNRAATVDNLEYLRTKRDRLRHQLSGLDAAAPAGTGTNRT